LIKKSKPEDYILDNGIIASAFPVSKHLKSTGLNSFDLTGDVVSISNNFNMGKLDGTFENTGLMIDGKVYTIKTQPNYDGKYTVLDDIIIKGNVDSEYYIDKSSEDKWEYLKGPKNEPRTNTNGFVYQYAEGKMNFPDPLDKASRTIITGEGGASPSRFKHVISTKKGLRRLTPIELERLNMFPDNHTELDGVTDTKRAFFMGNALVVGVIESIGKILQEKILGK
jgi:DNA (cytosine-5)-methyltransferase 1